MTIKSVEIQDERYEKVKALASRFGNKAVISVLTPQTNQNGYTFRHDPTLLKELFGEFGIFFSVRYVEPYFAHGDTQGGYQYSQVPEKYHAALESMWAFYADAVVQLKLDIANQEREAKDRKKAAKEAFDTAQTTIDQICAAKTGDEVLFQFKGGIFKIKVSRVIGERKIERPVNYAARVDFEKVLNAIPQAFGFLELSFTQMYPPQETHRSSYRVDEKINAHINNVEGTQAEKLKVLQELLSQALLTLNAEEIDGVMGSTANGVGEVFH